ncbi:glycosyl transferase [Vibrio ishigakensis]|uniref:Glycosyl transferase n=1 Tax=Vibrio ishigakensis TaxID=1481914 RepID=A0A0B8NYE5_9VIBR|nr:glycosyltransferase [Vibrio ishigakensis]GAM59550.1 glycosyl transferase [Vibrio ishigakensis]
MKITLVTLDITLKGGIERVVSILASYFYQQEIHVKIVSVFKSNKNISYSLPDNIEVEYLCDSEYKNETLSSRLKNYLVLIMLILKLKIRNDEIVISTLTNISCILGFRKIFDRKIKFIAAEHSQYYAHGKLVRFLRKVLFNSCEYVVLLTKQDKEIYNSFLNKSKVYLIRNPVSYIPIFSSSLNYKRLVSIGRLEPVKGYQDLIPALSQFFKVHNDWKLDIYGEGSLRGRLEKIIIENDLENHVFLRGFHNDLQAEIMNASIYLCYSETEAFPMSFLEAFSVGLPIISNDCPFGPGEIIDNRINGFLVKDKYEFTKQLYSLVEDEHVYSNMSRAALSKCDSYSINEIGPIWIELIGNCQRKR